MKRFMLMAFLSTYFLISCENTPQPADICDEDAQWAKAIRNGDEVCLPELNISYFFSNTPNAIITFQAGGLVDKEILADFSVPEEGVTLQTKYSLKEGSLFGADPLVEGSISFLTFDPPTPIKAGCIAGTFSLKSGGPNAPASFEYTNGRFAFFKRTVQEDDRSTPENTGCTPF